MPDVRLSPSEWRTLTQAFRVEADITIPNAARPFVLTVLSTYFADTYANSEPGEHGQTEALLRKVAAPNA